MDIITTQALVVGSGAAGLNAAHELALRGVDALILTDNPGGGTSFQAGSDKQTYYKPDAFGDSTPAMAQAFFASGGMHGDTARMLAGLSARGFYKLMALGVPFPHNAYGETIGYRTDHDSTMRATSAGPLTSKFMGEALGKAVQQAGVQVMRGRLAALHATPNGVGVLVWQEDSWTLVVCADMVLATGGPAMTYADTVYPTAQPSALGAALRAGGAAENLCHWQYGLASRYPRWNLSGSYQQVLPRYVSLAADDTDTTHAREFLHKVYPDTQARLQAVFLKGYQWPFDAGKCVPGGSSLIDIAVHAEIMAGRRVYLDYAHNPEGFDITQLPESVQAYLTAAGALHNTPYARLKAMNPAAVKLFDGYGINLSSQLLEVSVCAQHINGGLAVQDWRTSLPHVYAAGETAGCFGLYRPGGSALNETQVGSLRAAQHIAHHSQAVPDTTAFASWATCEAGRYNAMAQENTSQGSEMLMRAAHARALTGKLARRMSQHAGLIRRDLAAQAKELRQLERTLTRYVAPIESTVQDSTQAAVITSLLDLQDVVTVQSAMLSAMLLWQEISGKHATGGAVHAQNSMGGLSKEDLPAGVVRTVPQAGEWHSTWMPRRPLPPADALGDGAFEDLWRQYQAGDFE